MGSAGLSFSVPVPLLAHDMKQGSAVTPVSCQYKRAQPEPDHVSTEFGLSQACAGAAAHQVPGADARGHHGICAVHRRQAQGQQIRLHKVHTPLSLCPNISCCAECDSMTDVTTQH